MRLGGAQGQVHGHHQDCPRSLGAGSALIESRPQTAAGANTPLSKPHLNFTQQLNSKFPGFAEAGLGFSSEV